MRAALATMLLQRERDTRRILLEEGVGVADALKAIRGPLFGLFLVAVDTGGQQRGGRVIRPDARKPGARAKLTGEAAPHAGTTITNSLLSPDFRRLRGELMRVLARYRDAQPEVAFVFRPAGLRPAAETSAGSKYDGSTSGRGRACRLTSR
jgi:hypothetical protein